MPLRRNPAGIVQGQKVCAVKVTLAKQMRRAMTADERIFWNEVRSNRLHGIHFRRQQVISGFIVDFYCDAARLAVELDGAGHDAEYDTHRDQALSLVGVEVLRIENAAVRQNLTRVLDEICECARERKST